MPRLHDPIRWIRTPFLAMVAYCALVLAVAAQDSRKPSAIKLPDGTVVLYTANPNDAAPKIDGVVLSAKEYQQLLDNAEQLKKLREARAVSPSVCRIRGRVDSSTGRPVAKLAVEYAYRTTLPRTPVLLGGQRTAPVSAIGPDGKVPVLELTADGLVVLVEQPGEGKVTLDLEAAIISRGGKNELGFEVGLPRAAITTLTFEPPGPNIKKLTVGTRTPEAGVSRPTELKRSTEDVSRYAPKPMEVGIPLGPIDLLDIAWESPAATSSGDASISAEAEIAIRVDESQIETTNRLRLRSPAREWLLSLPKDATVTVSRASTIPAVDSGVSAVRPTDDQQPFWKVPIPEAGEWTITATVRSLRPDPKDPKYLGPNQVTIGFALGIPRQSGTIRVYAPSTIRVANYRHGAEMRRLDAVQGTDAPVASFRYALAGSTAPRFDFEARPARGFTAVQPHHRLDLTHEGWRLRTELRVAPVRSTIEQLSFELPIGWREPIIRPDDRVDEVLAGPEANGKRLWTVRLANGTAEPFSLTVESMFAVPETANDVSLVLPRFPGATERETQVSVSVPEGLSVRATARDTSTTSALAPNGTTKPGAATQLSGVFETPITALELAWQPYRAELAATLRADVSLGERQMVIQQTIQFKATEPIGRLIRFKGPTNPMAFQSSPMLESAGSGLWTFSPSVDAREANVTLSYALPLPPRGDTKEAKPAIVDVPMFWPEATSVSATTRVWGTPSPGARRPTNLQGLWEERPPEPTAERDSLPWLTLAATGSAKPVPLAFELSEPIEVGGTVTERAVFQSWAAPDGTVLVRVRFLLSRWSAAGVDLELPAAIAPSFYVNRERVDPLAIPSTDGERAVRVPLPESKPNRTSIVLELQYSLPPQPRGEFLFVAPRIRGTQLATPARCHIAIAPQSVPLVFGATFLPDHRWGWRGGFPAPIAGMALDELDRWFLGGTMPPESDGWEIPTDDAVTGRLYGMANLRVVRVPRATFVLSCSLFAFILGYGISRLRPRLVGPGITLAGIAVIALGTLAPQPSSQALAASFPGIGALVILLGLQALVRWIARRRIDYLSTFRRESIPSAGAISPRPTLNQSSVEDSGRTTPSKVPSMPAVPSLSSQAPG